MFDVRSRIPREDFIKKVAKNQGFIFKPREIRKKIKEVYNKA